MSSLSGMAPSGGGGKYELTIQRNPLSVVVTVT